MRTTWLQAAECRLPLPRPILLGPTRITTRDVVAIRLGADDGRVGDALGYTRGTPLLHTLRHVGRAFLGVSPHARKGVVERFRRAHVNGAAAFVRALSLLDIALHDLAARALGQPLFRLLGGDRTRVPAAAVAGYYLESRTAEDVRDEVAALMDAGYPRAKVMIGGADPRADARLVALCGEVAPGRLGADAHWSWDSIPQALAACRRLDDLGLAFLEDPFGPHRSRWLERLQRHLKTPLAFGEDAPDADTLAALSRHVPVLRVDATTCGGVTSACAALQAAGLNGCEVFPHVHPQIHAQLAGAFPEIGYVELIPEAVGADPLHRLLASPLEVADGFVRLDEEPGAGLRLDWDAVEAHAGERFRMEWEA